MRGKETASASSSRSCVGRPPVRILGGRQSRSLVEFSRRPTPTTEILQRWHSRSVQSLPAHADFMHTTTYNQEDGGKLGRHTKTSLLRMKNRPVACAEPNYRELAKKKKQFAVELKCKALPETISARLPDDGSSHAFLTGARYNSAHHIDSRSLERLGLYVPRGNTSKPFVNPAGTIPPSPAIYGLKGCSKRSRLRNSRSFTCLPTPPRIALSGSTGFCVNGTSRYMYGGAGAAGEDGTGSVASIDREIEEIFGPNQGGSESESSSMIGQCEGKDSGSVRSATSVEVLSGSEEERELISEVREVAIKQKALGTVWELEEQNDPEQLEPCPSNTLQSHDRLTPSSLITLSEKPLLKSEECVAESPVQVEEGFEDTLTEPSIRREPEADNQLDLISPKAQMIADQILKEYQSSSTLIGSNLSECPTESEQQEVVKDEDLDVHIPTKYQHTQTELIEDLDRPISPTKQPTRLRPKSAECKDLQSSARSIFVDLSLTSLQAQSDDDDD